jgi:hypothetical protein
MALSSYPTSVSPLHIARHNDETFSSPIAGLCKRRLAFGLWGKFLRNPSIMRIGRMLKPCGAVRMHVAARSCAFTSPHQCLEHLLIGNELTVTLRIHRYSPGVNPLFKGQPLMPVANT